MPLRLAACFTALGLVLALPAAAQRVEAPSPLARAAAEAAAPVPGQPAPSLPSGVAREVPAWQLVGGGAIAGAAGMVAGGFAGYAVERAGECGDYFCGAGGALLGSAAGMTIGSSVGVHLANRSAGSYPATLLGGTIGLLAGTGAVVAAAMAGAEGAGFVALALIPPTQLAGAVIGQRWSERRRAAGNAPR